MIDDDIDVNALPVLLAGPIVRRLTRTEVSIWVALKLAESVRVVVHGPGGSRREATATPVRVGQHLWLSMVTIAAPDDAFVAGSSYSYELFVDQRAIDLAGVALSGADLPSFQAPPAELASLRVAHSSCRRPHAERRDGLALAGEQLDEFRPQLLVLSGDQIYADDVSPVFAARIRRVAAQLVGFDADPLLPNVGLNGRAADNEAFGITGGTGDHLWGLGEYYAHYLLAWSEVLWPSGWPSWTSATAMLPALSASDFAENHQPEPDAWSTDVRNLAQYRAGLPAVRRLLANTATLMTFDDHEVTDDWNLDFRWMADLYAQAAGTRIIANGLQAFALFQHWGDVPTAYADPSRAEHQVLQAATWSEGSRAPATIDAAQRERLGVPSAPPQAGQLPAPLRTLATGVRYDFRIPASEGWPLHIVALDERSARWMAQDDHPAGRVGPAQLDLMWPAPSSNEASTPTLLIAPAPVLGVHLWEQMIQPAAGLERSAALALDLEGWSHERASFEHLLARIHAWRKVIILSGDVHFGSTQSMVYEAGGQTSRAAQLTCSAAKYSGTAHRVLHLLGEAIERLGLTRVRTYVGWTALSQAQRDALEHPPSGTLPWDDGLDVLLGRTFRDGLEQPAVLPEETARAYNFHDHQWRYTLTPHDDLTGVSVPAPPQPWTGWDPDKSTATLRSLQAADLARIGRVYVGLPQYARISFGQGATLEVTHAIRHAIGHDAASGTANTTTTKVDLG